MFKVAVVNNLESTLAKNSECILPLNCEIVNNSITPTKSLLGSLLVLTMMALRISLARNHDEKHF